MKSHVYDFSARDAVKLAALPLLPLALFTLAMQLGAFAKVWPSPRPALDTDRTILLHQAEASRTPRDARVVLIGDSSCLMDISAPQLSESLGAPALNLGTLSYLDLNAFGTILSHCFAANPNQIQTVVLLMHPEALRRSSGAEYHLEALSHFHRGADYCGPETTAVLCGLGVEIFRGRFLSRLAPQPLEGSFGRRYGFTWDLWDYLSANRGSAIEPGTFDPASIQGNAEYRLAPRLEIASENFRRSVPPNVRLIAGITPVPASLADPNFPRKQREMLETWGGWLKADLALTNLPAILPDDHFASATHLNEQGAKLYTEALSRALATGM